MLRGVTPLLRIFDEERARAFYEDWLGFRRDWEHRFAPGMPLYAQVTREGVTLHLTAHHGDTTPGTRIRIRCDDVDALVASLAPVSWARPAVEERPWGERSADIADPFGNILTFWTAGGT